MGLKTIKGVDEKTWNEFKSLAAKRGIRMGKLLEYMIDSYVKDSRHKWETLLSGEKLLSEEEADEMKKIVRELRNEEGFRK